MSDQTQNQSGTLTKGNETKDESEPQDQDKKIWDKYYNGEIELPDVVKELKHYRNSKDTELETSDEDQREKDLKEYEQKYLSRYKQPKAKPIKSSNLKSGVDIGKLTLRQYVNTKRKAKQKEIKEYEQKYLSLYKQPKIQKKKASSSLYKP